MNAFDLLILCSLTFGFFFFISESVTEQGDGNAGTNSVGQ